MRHAAIAFLAAFALTLASRAEAQVIISGQVSTYTAPSSAPPAAGSAYVETSAGPAPTRDIHRSRPTSALLVPGIVALVGGYALNLFGLAWLAEGEINGGGYPGIDYYLYGLIPIAGPWLQFGASGPNSYVMSVITGVLEVGGLLLTILGASIQEEWDEPVYVLDESDPRSPTLAFGLDGALGGGAVATATLSHF
jgi:hypothetical protein